MNRWRFNWLGLLRGLMYFVLALLGAQRVVDLLGAPMLLYFPICITVGWLLGGDMASGIPRWVKVEERQ